MKKVFILSPAKTTGKRAAMMLNEQAEFPLAKRVRAPGAPIGEVFSFLSGLYFRGKIAYSGFFADPPADVRGSYVITSNAGLLCTNEIVCAERLKSFSNVEIDPLDRRYALPLRDTATSLLHKVGNDCHVILLGSIASSKYVDILLECFGEQLLFPKDFIGRGDMSRGGLMLRAVKSATELEYVALARSELRRGPRPPKLQKQA